MEEEQQKQNQQENDLKQNQNQAQQNSQGIHMPFDQIIQIFREFKLSIIKGDHQKITQILNTYQESLNLTNFVDPHTKQISIFFCAQIPTLDASAHMLKILLENNANANFKDSLQQSAAFYFSRDGRIKCLELLRQYGCSIHDQDQFGQNPLYYAARDGRIDTVLYLIDIGADVNHIDSINGQTALFYAARNGQVATAKLLIEKGCNLMHQDNKRQTAFYYAKKNKHSDIISLFQQYGTNQSMKNQLAKKLENQQAQSQSDEKSSTKKRKREREEAKICYKLVYTDQKGNSKELTKSEFLQFQKDYPQVAKLMLEADNLIDEKMILENKGKDLWEKQARKILNGIWKAKGANLFHSPVDPVKYQIDDYFDIIKNPIDFGTIKNKLNNNVYKDCDEFINDMNLVFQNCFTYNGTDSEVGKIGVQIQKEFDHICSINNIQQYLSDDYKLEQIKNSTAQNEIQFQQQQQNQLEQNDININQQINGNNIIEQQIIQENQMENAQNEQINE